jgi:hypothetical protein
MRTSSRMAVIARVRMSRLDADRRGIPPRKTFSWTTFSVRQRSLPTSSARRGTRSRAGSSPLSQRLQESEAPGPESQSRAAPDGPASALPGVRPCSPASRTARGSRAPPERRSRRHRPGGPPGSLERHQRTQPVHWCIPPCIGPPKAGRRWSHRREFSGFASIHNVLVLLITVC